MNNDKTLVTFEKNNKRLYISGNIRPEIYQFFETEGGDALEDGLEFFSEKRPVCKAGIRCTNALNDEYIDMMFDWVSTIIASTISMQAADYFSVNMKKGRSIDPHCDNPYKSDHFVQELSSSINADLTNAMLHEKKNVVNISNFFRRHNEYFEVALANAKDQIEKNILDRRNNDFRIIYVKYENGRIGMRTMVSKIYPNGKQNTVDGEWMTEKEMMKVFKELSEKFVVNQVVFVDTVPPDQIVDDLLKLFNNKVSLLSVPANGFLTIPKGQDDFYFSESKMDDSDSGAIDFGKGMSMEEFEEMLDETDEPMQKMLS